MYKGTYRSVVLDLDECIDIWKGLNLAIHTCNIFQNEEMKKEFIELNDELNKHINDIQHEIEVGPNGILYEDMKKAVELWEKKDRTEAEYRQACWILSKYLSMLYTYKPVVLWNKEDWDYAYNRGYHEAKEIILKYEMGTLGLENE